MYKSSFSKDDLIEVQLNFIIFYFVGF